MQRTFKYSLLTALVLSSASASYAEEGFRQHSAHVHGHVEFNIAQDGQELLVEITAPGSDVVGFENTPKNEQEHEKIEQAEEILSHPEQILLLSSSAGCVIEHVSVTNTLEEHDDHEGHDHDEHEGHDHDEHEGHDHDESSHGEFTVEYHFECENFDQLKDINTTWFKHFPSTEEISVNLLTDTTQKAVELNQNSTRIKL
jgi:hypothetical protein